MRNSFVSINKMMKAMCMQNMYMRFDARFSEKLPDHMKR